MESKTIKKEKFRRNDIISKLNEESKKGFVNFSSNLELVPKGQLKQEREFGFMEGLSYGNRNGPTIYIENMEGIMGSKSHGTVRKKGKDVPIRLHRTKISYLDNKIIGRGATSTIYQGYFDKIPAAVKRVESKYVDVYQNELKIWQEMKIKNNEEGNVNIVTLFTWSSWEDEYYFAMELAKCDLKTRVEEINKQNPTETERHIKKLKGFIRDAVKGLQWIHDSRVLHRDIKPENILIFKKASGQEMAKLGDFGISRKLSGVATGTNSVGKGTSDWMAPEVLKVFFSGKDKQVNVTKAVDIFSLGMTSHFILSLGTHPFGFSEQHGSMIAYNIKDASILPKKLGNDNFSADNLFQWMMSIEPTSRPKILQVVEHPFFWGWKRSMEFLKDVARCFNDRKNSILIGMHQDIDIYFQGRMQDLNRTTFNWISEMETTKQNILLRRKSKGVKHYDGESVMMLVELIRDKFMHYRDMPDEAINVEHFGDGENFVEEKYVKYFLSRFPQLVLFLFSFLANDKNVYLSSLKMKHLPHFSSVPIDWRGSANIYIIRL